MPNTCMTAAKNFKRLKTINSSQRNKCGQPYGLKKLDWLAEERDGIRWRLIRTDYS